MKSDEATQAEDQETGKPEDSSDLREEELKANLAEAKAKLLSRKN